MSNFIDYLKIKRLQKTVFYCFFKIKNRPSSHSTASSDIKNYVYFYRPNGLKDSYKIAGKSYFHCKSQKLCCILLLYSWWSQDFARPPKKCRNPAAPSYETKNQKFASTKKLGPRIKISSKNGIFCQKPMVIATLTSNTDRWKNIIKCFSRARHANPSNNPALYMPL